MTVCHLHYTKSEEQKNDDDMKSSDYMDIDTDCIHTDCKNADCITKDCINAKKKPCKLYEHRSHTTNLYCSNSYDMNLDRVTDSHVELNVLDDTQEFFSNGPHKISLIMMKTLQKLRF
jgi:hypothetical protein